MTGPPYAERDEISSGLRGGLGVHGGMLFGTVFGVAGLVLPLAVVCLLALGVAEACRRWVPALAPAIALRAGALVVLPTGERPASPCDKTRRRPRPDAGSRIR